MAVVELGLGPVRQRQRHAGARALGDLHAAGPGARLLPARLVPDEVRGRRVARGERLLERLVALVRLGQEAVERHPERRLRLGQRDAVLRALRAGQRRHDVAEVELERLGVRRLLRVLVVPQPLRLGVGLDALHVLGRAARELQVAQRLGVDREDRARRAELRRHVAERRAVRQRQVRDAGAVELDELADDAVLAHALGDGQHEVGGGGALAQLRR